MNEPQNKRKKSNYYSQKKRKEHILEPGLKGFLCTCNFREKECIKESYYLLNLFADILNEKINPNPVTGVVKDSNSYDDISDDLSREISSLKSEKLKRFQAIDSGAKNVIFIKTTIERPVELVLEIISDIILSKQQKTRFLYRLLPIEVTCKANITDIKVSMEKLICKYFSGEPKSYAIIFNYRNNFQMNRDEIISEIANLIASKNSKHVVNLKNADLSVMVEVIRGICMLSVVPNYMKYKKYNLIQLADSVSTPTEEKYVSINSGTKVESVDTCSEIKDLSELKDNTEANEECIKTD
ncbi:uncharacterized protein CBL_11590 [Carabus blaptoides fortunei]